MKIIKPSFMKKLSFVFLFITILLFFTNSALATKGDNVWGWAWSENIGWISFNNCTDPEGDPDGCSGVDYGVKISKESATQGCLSGYAWSENIGWIHFNEGSLPAELEDQTPKDCLAQIVKEGTVLKIKGWAKVVAGGSAEAGGWDGWIKLNGYSGADEPYLEKIDSKTSKFMNFAWGSDVVGWVSYSSANAPVYSVKTSYGLSNLPYVEFQAPELEDACLGGRNASFIFPFVYKDIDGDKMTKYDLEIVGTNISITVNTSANNDDTIRQLVEVFRSGNQEIKYRGASDYPAGGYAWRIRVYNENNEQSDWIEAPANKYLDSQIPNYPYPDVADNWNFGSSRFTPGTKVSTVNNVSCYNNDQDPVNCTWLWTYTARDPKKDPVQKALFSDPAILEDPPALESIDVKEPLVFFDKAANYTITLKATDGDGNSCEFSRNVTASTLRYLEPDDPTILDLISKAFDYLQAQANQTLDWVKSLPLIFN